MRHGIAAAFVFSLLSTSALAAGLTFRPLSATASDTLAWFKSQPPERQAKLKAGLSPEREASLLAAWKASPRG